MNIEKLRLLYYSPTQTTKKVLKDLAVEAGFKPIAGGAFIGEHSFADSKFPIAHRRPDQKDNE